MNIILINPSASEAVITGAVIFTIIGMMIFIILIAAGNITDKREKKRLGRRGSKHKQESKQVGYCYKNCSMISNYQKCLLEQESDNVALQEQIGWLRQRIREKETEIVELRATLYELQK